MEAKHSSLSFGETYREFSVMLQHDGDVVYEACAVFGDVEG